MRRCWVSRGHLMLTLLQLLITSQTCFSSYVLWPSWWWQQQGGVMAIYLVTEARNLRVNSDHSLNTIQNMHRTIMFFSSFLPPLPELANFILQESFAKVSFWFTQFFIPRAPYTHPYHWTCHYDWFVCSLTRLWALEGRDVFNSCFAHRNITDAKWTNERTRDAQR